jgi:hypothetical protein
VLAERPTTTSMPLTVRHAAELPPAAPRPQPQQPPAPQPTEPEQRAVLVQRKQAREVADAALLRAGEAMQRAQRHVAACGAALAGFDDLDDAITDATIEALRSGEGRPRVDVPDHLRQRITERDAARAALAGAERAAEVFARELAASRGRAEAAQSAVDTAVKALIERAKEVKRDARAEHLRLADALRVDLIDDAGWRSLHDALVADPQAPLAYARATTPLPPRVVDTTKPPPGEPRWEDEMAARAAAAE